MGVLEEKAELLVEGFAFGGRRGVGRREESEEDGEFVAAEGSFGGEGLEESTDGGEGVVEVLVGEEGEFPVTFVKRDLGEAQESVYGAFDIARAGGVPSDGVSVGADGRAEGFFLEGGFSAIESGACAEVAFEVERSEDKAAKQQEESQEALVRAHRHQVALPAWEWGAVGFGESGENLRD